jgi:hypothetical protein
MLAISVALTGCVPLPYTFHQLEYPGGENKRTGNCSGPADELRFPFHGIYISVRIDAQVVPNFGVSIDVPAGHVARLQSAEAVLTSKTPSGEIALPIVLVPYNTELTKVYEATQPMVGRTSKFRHLFGVDDIYAWFPFKSREEPIEAGEEGQLRLPNLYVDDVLYSGPVIPYRKVTSVSIAPLNC